MLRQKHGIREGSRLASMLIYLATGLCCIVTVYPMYYVLIRSVSAPEHALAGDMLLFPKGFDLNSYRVILSDTTLWRAYGNTLLYVVVTTLLMLLFCTLCAYPLCMPGLLGKKAVVTYLLVPMYFSGGLIPTFLVMNRLGLYNNIWAVILPGSLSIWNIILARTYFASIPDTIRESAAIDGASHFTILLRIYTPLAKPILAVISIYTIHAGNAHNIVPDTVEMTGTVRTLDPADRDRMEASVKRVAASVAEAYRCTADVEYLRGAPPFICEDEWVDRALRVGKKVLGEENTKIMPYAAMGAEDFAFIKEKKPGIFVRLGARTPGGPYGSAHSPTFYCDNACIPVGMLTIIGLAADYLGFEI